MRNEVRIPIRALRIGALLLTVVVAIAAALSVPGSRQAIVAAGRAPITIADGATLEGQRQYAEVALARGLARQVEQLRKVRELRLPVTDAEAEARTAKALADLRAVRHDALVAVGSAYGMDAIGSADYATKAEVRLDGFQNDGSSALLAPHLMVIVARADQLYAQIGDQAVRGLTTAPSPSPSATPPLSASPTAPPPVTTPYSFGGRSYTGVALAPGAAVVAPFDGRLELLRYQIISGQIRRDSQTAGIPVYPYVIVNAADGRRLTYRPGALGVDSELLAQEGQVSAGGALFRVTGTGPSSWRDFYDPGVDFQIVVSLISQTGADLDASGLIRVSRP